MIQVLLDVAKQRIPTMSDDEIAAACSEVLRLQNFDILNVVNPDDVAELQALLGMEVQQRRLMERQPWLRRKTDR